MTFRTRLLVNWIVAGTTRRAFEQMDDARTAALVAQFRRVDGIANAAFFDLPETYAARARVRMWLEPGISRMGWLQLADVWVEAAP
jgi:hypothetical protein